jgi:hypothetical protein
MLPKQELNNLEYQTNFINFYLKDSSKPTKNRLEFISGLGEGTKSDDIYDSKLATLCVVDIKGRQAPEVIKTLAENQNTQEEKLTKKLRNILGIIENEKRGQQLQIDKKKRQAYINKELYNGEPVKNEQIMHLDDDDSHLLPLNIYNQLKIVKEFISTMNSAGNEEIRKLNYYDAIWKYNNIRLKSPFLNMPLEFHVNDEEKENIMPTTKGTHKFAWTQGLGRVDRSTVGANVLINNFEKRIFNRIDTIYRMEELIQFTIKPLITPNIEMGIYFTTPFNIINNLNDFEDFISMRKVNPEGDKITEAAFLDKDNATAGGYNIKNNNLKLEDKKTKELKKLKKLYKESKNLKKYVKYKNNK